MWKLETIIVAVCVFIGAGFIAYVLEAITFRNRGVIGSYESLWEYFKKIDQKHGNIAAIVWALIWIILLVIAAFVIYLAS
jgi:hypothetical protein